MATDQEKAKEALRIRLGQLDRRVAASRRRVAEEEAKIAARRAAEKNGKK